MKALKDAKLEQHCFLISLADHVLKIFPASDD